MSNVSQYSTTAGNNNSASPDGFPEGMAPSGVNDSAREVMAALAKWYGDTNGTITTAGTGNTYTLTTNNAHAALADQSLIVFECDRANTGAATLNVDSLGAKSIETVGGEALVAGDLVANKIQAVVYNATDDTYQLIDTGRRDTVNPYSKQQGFSGVTTLTDAASISWDLDAAQVAEVTLGGNRTLSNPTNVQNGFTYVLFVIQDGTGSRTLSYGSNYLFPSGVAPTLSTASGDVDIITFVARGGKLYGVEVLNFS